jgi:predicted transcriptional regulator YdeE
MGGGSVDYIGLLPSVVQTTEGYITTWWGDDNRSRTVDNEFEIWAQRLKFDQVFSGSFEDN